LAPLDLALSQRREARGVGLPTGRIHDEGGEEHSQRDQNGVRRPCLRACVRKPRPAAYQIGPGSGRACGKDIEFCNRPLTIKPVGRQTR